MSFCIYTVLFTLESREPETNEYIKIFYIWLSQICKLKAADRVVLLTDSRTSDYLSKSFIMEKMLREIKFTVNILLFPPPKTLLEGMTHKYATFDYAEDYLMYADLDIMFLKHPSLIVDGDDNDRLMVQFEMDINSHGYMEAMTEEERVAALKTSALGISAGKFIIRGKKIRDVIFKIINDMIGVAPDIKYYTIEQPIFNKVVFLVYDIIPVKRIPNEIISANFFEYTEKSVLMDLFGDPGNGQTHLNKVIEFIAYTNMKV